MTDRECDYLVVGAGSAGCVVANRLSPDPGNEVILLEAGGRDRNPWLHIPIGYAKVHLRPQFNWIYPTEPEAQLNDRSTVIPRGKVLGGSSAINGLVYIRGHPSDYDHWRQLGNEGWSYDDVLPYFRKSEDQARGADEFHGVGGPLKVEDQRQTNPLSDAFIAASVEAGIPYNPDHNGASQEGAGYLQSTAHKGRRWSTATAYLKPVRHRRNLHVVTDANAQRIIFDGRRAVGVECRIGGVLQTIRARKEVILCAGAAASPQLLQVSGVGPADLLSEFGIPVVHDLPGVGGSLQDHLTVNIPMRSKQRLTVNDAMANPFSKLKMGLQYALLRKGPMSYAAGYASAFVRTMPDLATPDIEVILVMFSRTKKLTEVDPFPGFTAMTFPLRPQSRGSLRIRSPHMDEMPRIHFNYLSAAYDRDTTLRGLRKIGEIFHQPAMAPFFGGAIGLDPVDASDEQLMEHARAKGVTAQHISCTCRMGNDPLAVVDARFRVKGIDALRVVDAAAMPTIVTSSLNATIVMMAEKASDMILADAR